MLIKAIDTELSFVVQNVDLVLRARAKKAESTGKKIKPWDGTIRFLAKSQNGTYFFPIGLLPRVKKILKWFGIDYTENINFSESSEALTIPWMGPDLRVYQIDAFIEAMKAERAIINIPTGSGKTLTTLKMISVIGKPTLIIVHRKELLNQWITAIKEYTGLDAVSFTDKNKEFGVITVAMVQSLYNYLKKEKMPVFDVIVVDEVHHIACETFYEVAIKCDAKYRIGLTATTKREDGADLYLESGIGPICISIRPEDLIEQKHLALPQFEFVDIPGTSYRRYAEFRDEYKHGIALNTTRNEVIVKRARQLVNEGRLTYIHVEHISHGKLLSEMSGIPFVYSKTKNRDEIIEKFKTGEIKAVISTLLGEGVDIPDISAIIMAGGRKTKIGTVQKVGRCLRPSGNQTSIIVDFIDKGNHLSRHTHQRYETYCEFFGEYVKTFKRS